MYFCRDELQFLFDWRFFQRGIAYAEENRAIDVQANPAGGTASALVRGSRGKPYRVIAHVSRDATGQLQAAGECTCPVGRNCKHVVAVLWILAGRHEEALRSQGLTQPLAVWLDTLERAGRSRIRPAPDNHLLYLLATSPGGEVSLQVVRVRRLKSGGWGKPQPFGLTAATAARFLTAGDRHIAIMLDQELFRRERPQLRTAAVLEAIIETGRAYHGPVDRAPLALGPPRGASLRWEADESGDQRLGLVLEGDGVGPLQVNPPWYLDPQAGTCGPIEVQGLDGAPPELLRTLLHAPPVPPEAVESLSRRLAHLVPVAHLPRPHGVKIQRAAQGEPRPYLSLFSEQMGASGLAVGYGYAPQPPHWEHRAALSFEYEGQRVAVGEPAAELRVTRPDGIRLIPRDRQAEERAATRLRELGLVPLDAHGVDVYVPAAGMEGWLDLLDEGLQRLRAEGWRIETAPDFRLRPVPTDEWYVDLTRVEGGTWFDVELGVQVEGQRVPLLPIVLDLLRTPGLDLDDPELDDATPIAMELPGGGLLRLPLGRIRLILSTLLELYDEDVQATKARLPRLAAHGLAALEALGERPLRWRGDRGLRELGERLRQFEGVAPLDAPEGFRAVLRDYQRHGLGWLQFLREYDLAGVLADDMGLGKTVQALAHIATEKAAGRLDRPVLVVAPTSLMFNWRHEAERFVPGLRVLTLHGPDRKAHFARVPEHDLVLTTYPLLPRDHADLAAHEYHVLVLDEAQHIKNPRAKVAQVVKRLHARHRLCLTGTPMENHLGELWSLFDFLLPGFLGDAGQFRRRFRTPIEDQGDEARRAVLARRLAPFMLRRTKEAVATELPPKTEILRSVPLEGRQRDLYETVRLAMHKKVRSEIARKGLARSHIIVLEALLKLRQICCDPRLLPGTQGQQVKQSAKLELLMALLPELLEEGRRVLLFSQFTTMLALIEEAVRAQGIDYVKLTGRTRDRQTPIEAFQAGQVPLFLISLKAGGTGLNLTAADTVIHYDPWWNPAVESQATDRAHRIGQDKPVFVYKLLTEDTVETRIAEMQVRKAALAQALFAEGGKTGTALSAQDLEALFEPLG